MLIRILVLLVTHASPIEDGNNKQLGILFFSFGRFLLHLYLSIFISQRFWCLLLSNIKQRKKINVNPRRPYVCGVCWWVGCPQFGDPLLPPQEATLMENGDFVAPMNVKSKSGKT